MQAKNLHFNPYIYIYIINQICYTILHPAPLVTLLKWFILFVTGLLVQRSSKTLVHNVMAIYVNYVMMILWPRHTNTISRASHWLMLLSDFINLTHVHNFTVSAQDIFTFRRLSVFTVSFTGILQLLMQIMKRFVPSYWLVKWLWYRVYNQKVVSSSPHVCVCACVRVCVFYLYTISLSWFIIDVPRSLRNEILDHSVSKGWCVTRKMSQSVWNIFRDYWKILFHNVAKIYG